jgi:hypothetical protein
MMSLLEMCKWIQVTPLSVSIRESIVTFGAGRYAPAWYWIVGRHHRHFGSAHDGPGDEEQSASEVFHRLIPWSIAGFATMLITGFLLFWAEPVKCYLSTSFRYKTLFLFLAAINVAVFHSSAVYKKMGNWEWSEDPPRAAKLAGLISLIRSNHGL